MLRFIRSVRQTASCPQRPSTGGFVLPYLMLHDRKATSQGLYTHSFPIVSRALDTSSCNARTYIQSHLPRWYSAFLKHMNRGWVYMYVTNHLKLPMPMEKLIGSWRRREDDGTNCDNTRTRTYGTARSRLQKVVMRIIATYIRRDLG